MNIPFIPEETLELLEWEKIRSRVEQLCSTEAGRVRAREITFSHDPEEVRRALGEVTQMRSLLSTENLPPLTPLPVVDEELERARAGGILPAATLGKILSGLLSTERIRRFFRERKGKYPLLSRIVREIPDLSSLTSYLDSKVDEKGDVRETASPILKQLKERLERARKRVQETAQAIMDHPTYRRHLQDRFVTLRGERSVLPFKPSIRSVSRGILHETSQSGQTLYFEPEELVQANNEYARAKSEFDEEVTRILAEVSLRIGGEADQVADAFRWGGYLDYTVARALFGEELGGSEPAVQTSGRVRLVSARHPILVMSGKDPVPNDVSLGGERNFLIVTGPNAGGKTVLLKTVGLSVLMTMAGLPIPAGSDSTVSLFEKVLVAMGDMQALDRDLSTFSADILALKKFYEEAHAKTLILLDEVITGTDPKEGGALGRAFLKKLADRGAVGIVTTHFEEVKYLPFEDRRFAVGTMGFSETEGKPTFRLEEGIPGRSMGISVAEKLGFPQEIIAEARKNLGEEGENVEALVRELTSLREEQARLREKLEEERKRLRQERERLEEQRKRLLRQREELIQEAREKALSLISRVEERVREVQQELKKSRKLDVVRKASEVMRTLKKEVGEKPLSPDLQKKMSSTRPVSSPDEVRPGMTVFVPSLEKDGTVESVGKDEVSVAFGLVKTRVKLHDIRVYGHRGREAEEKRRRPPLTGKGRDIVVRGSENTIDLRGKTAEEALEEVDRFLDGASLRGVPAVFIIHGHGTGILRKRVRDYLKESPYVSSFRPGDESEGGDGVTVAYLE